MKNTEEQEYAINTKAGCVVSAGAGSGKTRVLANRFLRYVKEGTDCRKILTITFTRKAAASMREKIRDLLEENRMEDQLALFHGAHISTVDSFCLEVVRKDCRRYGLPGTVSIRNDDDFETVLDSVARQTLCDMTDKEGVKFFLKHANLADTVAMLKTIGRKQSFVRKLNTELSVKRVNELFDTEFEQTRTDMIEAAKFLASLFSEELKLEEEARTMRSLIQIAEDREKMLSEDGMKILSVFTLPAKYGRREYRERVTDEKKRIKNDLEKLNLIIPALNNPGQIKSVYTVADCFLRRLDSIRLRSGQISFTDAMHLAIDILITNKGVRDYYKKAFDYIMIDEFQDNNDDYRKLLYLLAEKQDVVSPDVPDSASVDVSKIFLVGDEKQSIYRFRGADVTVFKTLKDEIVTMGGEALKLSINFRSTETLLNVFNSIFPEIMTESGRPFNAGYSPLESAPDADFKSRVILHTGLYSTKKKNDEADDSDFESSTENEAAHLVDLILEMVNTDNFLIHDEGSKDSPGRRPCFSDIAVLLRTLSNQHEYEKVFRVRGIPYVQAEERGLGFEAVLNDFYCLLNLVVNPDDEICIQALENSPLRNVSEEETGNLLRIVSEAGLAGAIDYIWFDLGYRLFIISKATNAVYSGHYDKLYSFATRFDEQGKGLPAFLQFLRNIIASGRTDNPESFRTFEDRAGGVTIMTIHKSKGLEFPIVILANMENTAQNNSEHLPVIISQDGTEIFLPCMISDSKIVNPYAVLKKDEEAERENAELKRLFYVGATRAMQHLVFSASVPLPGDSTDKVKSDNEMKNMIGLLFSACNISIDGDNRELLNVPSFLETRYFDSSDSCFGPLSPQDSSDKASVPECILSFYGRAKPDTFNPGIPSVGVTSLIRQEPGVFSGVSVPESETEMLPSLPSDSVIQAKNIQTEFGTYVHSIIEKVIKGELSAPQKMTEPAFSAELSENQLKTLFSDATALASGFLNSSLYRKLVSSSCTFYPERRFVFFDSKSGSENGVENGTEGGFFVKGSIDLLAVNEKTAYILDFKTDNSLAGLDEYNRQLDFYAKAVRSVYPQNEVVSKLVFLRKFL